jgi:hypothetical protein
MQNAHLRLGRLQYTRNTEKTNTQISVHVDHYIGNGEQAHLLSVFGGDAEVGAIRAAIYERHTFTLNFQNGAKKPIVWPHYTIRDALTLEEKQEGCSGSVSG